uniref:Gnk2-homologous domain-containing protein n=1 Tax=Ananas comosus var. bracteatus TaxID=296719 RepID=A0A6V7PVG0_ANACO|nr:unnamed protein product [Ananas comosus var. bracteatus]
MRYMDRNGFWVCDFGVLLVILTCSCFLRTASGDPRTVTAGQFCGNSSSLSGSVFAINFVPAMDNLSSAVTSNGYGIVVMGQSPNAVFGLGQCMEDLNSTDCKLCFSEIRSLLPKCYPNTTGRVYLDGCFGRYANYLFFNDVIDSLDQSVCTTGNNSASPNDFGKAVEAVIGNVTAEAIRSNKGYAVRSASVSNTSAYALAQCWQILSQPLCSTCLNAAASSIVSCLPAVEGRALFAGCYMRYSTELFWNVYQMDQALQV